MRSDYATDPVIAALRAERLRQGLTLQQVAERMSRGTYQSVWQWESGANNPTVASLRAWAGALGFDLALVPAEEVARRG